MKSYKILLPVLLVLGFASYADGTVHYVPSGDAVNYDTASTESKIKINNNDSIILKSGDKLEVSGEDKPVALKIDVSDSLTLKEINIDGTITNDNDHSIAIVGDKTNDIIVEKGINFGSTAILSAKDQHILVIKDNKSFKGNITNKGKLGDKTTKAGFVIRKEAVESKSLHGNIVNDGSIESYYQSIIIDATIDGKIINNGDIICYGDDRIKSYDTDKYAGHPTVFHFEDGVTAKVENNGLIKGRRTFYTGRTDEKGQLEDITIINNGIIDGFIDDHENDIAITLTNNKSGIIKTAEEDAKSIANAGTILIKPENVVTAESGYTYKGYKPDQSLRVMTTLNNSGTIEADGHYWVANTTTNTGTLKVNCLKKGLHGDAAITINNQGDFSFNYVTSDTSHGIANQGKDKVTKELPLLQLANSKNVTMCAGNTIDTYTSTAGKLQLTVDFDKHEHATSSYSLTDAMLTATDIILDSNSVIVVKAKDVEKLKAESKNSTSPITILSATNLKADVKNLKSGYALMLLDDTKIEADTLKAKIIFVNKPSEALTKQITTNSKQPVISKEVAEFADILFNPEVTTKDTKEAKAIKILQQVYGKLTEDTTIEELKGIIEAIVPEKIEVADTVATELGSQSANTVVTHMSNLRSGVNSSGENSSCAIWGQTAINSATKKSTIESSGYDSNFTGFTLGLENNLDQLVYGISWGYTAANVDLDNSKNKTYRQDVKMNSFSIYATKTLDSCFVDSTLSYNRANNKVADGKGEARLIGDYNSHQYQIMLAAGKSFMLSRFVLEPKLAIKMLAVHTDSYDLANITADVTKANLKTINRNLYAELGIKASYPLVNSSSKMIPFISANYYNNVYNNNAIKEIIFLNQKFTSANEKIKHQFATDIGFDFTVNNLEFYAAYTFSWKKNYKANNLAVRVKYLF